MDPVEYAAQYGDEIAKEWALLLKRGISEDIAQETACIIMERQVEGNIGGYMALVAHEHKKWGYSDGRKWAGTGPQHYKANNCEMVTDESYEDPRSTPSPYGQIEAKELLEYADPRLVECAYESEREGQLAKPVGYSAQAMSKWKRKFKEAIA